ncbi:MAG: DUF11 domain-containing protein [Candidatus Nanopelagicales bacterium]|nr:DUF11 domain-containing protein [Candidatus Nanopelagicales bacterium]
MLIASSLAASSLGLAVATPAAAAASITLDKQAPASVLLGDPIPYTLKATNPAGNDPLYNVSFSDVLPAGFEYVGPTDPSGLEQRDRPAGRLVFRLEFQSETQVADTDHYRPCRQEHRLRGGLDQRAQGA